MSLIHRTLVFVFCSIVPILNGCKGYAVTVNEQPVYTPSPLPALKAIADANLAGCVEQTAMDQEIRQAGDLERLICTNGGIKSLAGIEQFGNLKQLDLSHNRLTRIEPLYTLAQLRELRLQDNPELSCGDVETLAALRGDQLSIERPRQCRQGEG